MAVLDHVGVDHLVSKISEKISSVEGLTNEAYNTARVANSMASAANDKADDALKRAVSIEIHYTTSDNQPLISAGTNNYVLSDTYENGKGVIVVNPSEKTLSVGVLGFTSKNRLTSIVLPQNHFQTMGALGFNNITGLTHFEVPDSITVISGGTFGGSHLETIKLGNGLTEMAPALFADCVNLEQVVIPDSVKSVETNVFSGCTSLTSITFGSGVTGITGYAVMGCPNIERIYMRSTTPPNITPVSFSRGNNNTFKFYVPIESVDAYKQARNWSSYADRIVGIVFEDENIVSGENIKTINGQSLLGSGDIDVAQKSDLSKYLPLSGGTMTGNLVTKQINVEAGNWVVTNGTGLLMQRSDGPSYIWNKTTGHSISIGTNANGDTSELNASLNIKGNDVYPGPNETINLGIDAHTFNNIKGNRIQGKKFISGNYNRSDFINSLTTGLQISTNVQKSDNNTAGDYGFPASNNANGVLSFRVHNGNSSFLSDYCHYLGFSQKGLFYRNNNATSDNWVKLNNPSILSISVPEIEYSSSPKILPEILNDNICNIFHDIPKTQILIERSQDGTTWTDTTETDYPKFKQVMSSGKGAEVPVVAYDGANGQVGDRVRITINGAAAYARLSHLYVYYSTMGNTTKLTVEKNSYSDQNTWTTLIDKQSCVGWSGPNYYGLNNSYFGRTGGNEGYSYRLTFEITAITSGQTNIGYLNNIWAFSSDRPWSKTANPTQMFYFNTNRWKFATNKSIEPLSDVTYTLGSSNYRWSSIYAKDFYGTNFYGTAQKATQDGSGNTITSTYAKLASNNVFTAQQKVVYNGRATLIKNGTIGFIDPNTSSWAYATSMFDTTGENTLANICGAKGGNNTVQYVYMGGTFDKPWLKVTPTGALASPFISKISGNLLASWTRNLCNHTAIYGSSQTHNSCVIKTGIPVSTGKLYQMHVYGYNYQAGGQVDFTIGFYMYNGTPLKIYGVSNGTLTNPHYYIGKYTENEVEKVCVYWTCDDLTGNNQQHYVMVDALDNSNTWSIEEYTTEVAATITSMTEASLHERMTLNKAETVTGNKTFTGAFNANTNINIGSSYGINFNRNDYNYINIPTGDYSALAICKGGMSEANTLYVMNGSALFPYNNNNNDLGTSDKTWKNVYATTFNGTLVGAIYNDTW